jgi:hypothetical protein
MRIHQKMGLETNLWQNKFVYNSKLNFGAVYLHKYKQKFEVLTVWLFCDDYVVHSRLFCLFLFSHNSHQMTMISTRAQVQLHYQVGLFLHLEYISHPSALTCLSTAVCFG